MYSNVDSSSEHCGGYVLELLRQSSKYSDFRNTTSCWKPRTKAVSPGDGHVVNLDFNIVMLCPLSLSFLGSLQCPLQHLLTEFYNLYHREH